MGGQGLRDNCLGGSNGAGFGWENIDVWKFGVQYQLDDKWTFRAGYNRSDNPVTPANVTFNIIAPGVVENQFTLGTTYMIDKQSAITGTFMYADENSVTGTSLFAGFLQNPAVTETIGMKQYLLGVAYSRSF